MRSARGPGALLPPYSKQQRGPRWELVISLLLNALLLLAMAYGAAKGSGGTASRTADLLEPDAAGGGGGAGGGGSLSDAEVLLDGLRQQTTGLVSHLRQGAAGSASAPRYWLTIGIPTVPRKLINTTYLTTTLETLLDELPADPLDLLHGRVKVLVMNNAPQLRHPEFQALRQRVAAAEPNDRFAAKAAIYIDFVDNPGTVVDPAPDLPDPDDLNNPGDRPGRHVRKQTCDLISLMRLATPLSTYYLFMEDDFETCQYGLRALQYALAKANALPHLHNWLALRVSYGMNGVLMRNADLPALADFMWRFITLKPPDLLWVEYLLRQPAHGVARYDAEGLEFGSKPLPTAARRPFVVFKYNLMAHLGTVSSFAVRPDRPAWPGCYSGMVRVWSLQAHERFAPRCYHADLSPCPLRIETNVRTEPWLRVPLDWPAAVHAAPDSKGGGGGGLPAQQGRIAEMIRQRAQRTKGEQQLGVAAAEEQGGEAGDDPGAAG